MSREIFLSAHLHITEILNLNMFNLTLVLDYEIISQAYRAIHQLDLLSCHSRRYYYIHHIKSK